MFRITALAYIPRRRRDKDYPEIQICKTSFQEYLGDATAGGSVILLRRIPTMCPHVAKTERPRGSTRRHTEPHATFEIQQPADVFQIDATISMGAHHPLLPLQFQAEQNPGSKVLQHCVLRILELREFFKSFYEAIGVYCIVAKVAAHILAVQITGIGN